MNQPNPKLHFYISMIKSTVRMYAGYQLSMGDLVMAGGYLILAEVVGIIEEMV